MKELYRKIDRAIKDFYKTPKKALMLTGARQTGKTYAVRRFGKDFKAYAEINFIDNPEAKKIFRNYNGVSELLLRISAFVRSDLIPGETLIFFDEAQECPELITAIKFLVDDGTYSYIMSGSLLGVEMRDIRSLPVGYVGIREMYPLDIEEFMLNLGISFDLISRLRECWEGVKPVDEVIHGRMLEVFRLYLVVGGMPAAVVEYLETNNLRRVLDVQLDIVNLYRLDISKYSERDKLKIREIFDIMPSELDAKNKRFILKRLNEHAKFERYKESFLWLKDAGVAIPAYNVSEVREPLRLSENRSLFKLFSNDVGLLCAQYGQGLQMKVLTDAADINFGSVFENVAAQEFAAHGFSIYYYNNKHRGEVDFVLPIGGEAVPVEIKSGKSYTEHRALSGLMEGSEPYIKQAYVFSHSNIYKEGRIIYAPIYMLMFVKWENETPGLYSLDLSGL